MTTTITRNCRIVDAAIELQNGAGDGAYDLHDISGSPDEIGQAIAASLKETDMMTGRTAIIEEQDGELYLTLRIKFARHEVSADD